jgi:ELWxxDGT repeat protein
MKTSFWRRWCNSLRIDRPRAKARREPLCLQALDDRVTPTLTPQMVLDINSTSPGSNPSQLVVVGSTTYFVADDGVGGMELWKSDGTTAGTVMLRGFEGTIDHGPRSLTNVNGTLFFSAFDSTHGIELWKSDGTAAGTVLVKDIDPGSDWSRPSYLTNVNGTLYFSAYNPTSGTELWKSDGTTTGTVLVKDVYAGGASSPGNLTNVNGTLFFTASNGTHGIELWKSDGTAAGTVLVKDMRSGPGAGSYPGNLTNVNGTLFFTANDDIHGNELWKSDGTAAGTVLVKDIDPRASYGVPFSSTPTYLTAVNGTLFFSAFSVGGRELCRSDGTAPGTVIIKDISPDYGSYPRSLAAVGGTLFFSANDGVHHDELWKTDGTAAGTVMVKDINPDPVGASAPSSLVNVNGTLYFTVSYWNVNGTPSSNTSVELWKSDGTAAGTVLVKGFDSGSTPALRPGSLTNANGTLMFAASDTRNGRELWRSDGTAAGTTLVKDINATTFGSGPGSMADIDGTLFFAADDGVHGIELWKSDGTVAGTTLVKDIFPGGYTGYYGGYYARGSSPGQMTNVNGTLFFSVWNAGTGSQLWKSDGTEAGTVLVARTNADNLTAVGDTLFFTAGSFWSGSLDGIELWKSDGTEAGTVLVKDIFPGMHIEYGYYGPFYVPNSSNPGGLKNLNGTLYFSAYDGENGRELWKSDGTEAGTVLVKDIFPGTDSGSPGEMTIVNGTLFFSARDGLTTGWELWRSDGTAAGTTLVKDIRPGSNGSYPSSLTNLNGTLFFGANDGSTGQELWRSDGTAAGTVMVKDIRPGSGSSSPLDLTAVNGTLFFSAFDTTGRELWRSDGTAAGTGLVADINPGGSWSTPEDLTDVNGTLFFRARSDGTGASNTPPKLWTTDGTAAGTAIVANLVVSSLTSVDGTLFFSAADSTHGQELWMVTDDGLPSVSVGDATVTEGHAGTRSATFTVTLSTASDQPVTVAYSTADGTATAGSDYQADSGTLTFAPGELSKSVTVLVNGDGLAEPNETFLVNLSAPTNATIADGQGLGTILDDEPRLNIGDATIAEGHIGTRAATFTVTLSAASDQPVTVAYATADSSAAAGSDYQAKSGTLTFAPGQTTQTVTVLVVGNRLPESSETFLVNLSSPTGATIADGQGLGTILDDEPRVSISDFTRAEGRKGTTTLFTFTVTLSVAYDQPVTMSFRTVNGTAKTSNGDYVAKTGTLTFAPGETTKTITITVKGDSKREADETFHLDLFGLSGNAQFTKSRGTGTILNDD